MRTTDIAPQFRDACSSAEGLALRLLIEAHADEMVQQCNRGEPALAAIIPLLPLHLANALTRDDLMHAFGHMARLEMADRGLGVKIGPQHWSWPEIRRASHLETFGR